MTQLKLKKPSKDSETPQWRLENPSTPNKTNLKVTTAVNKTLKEVETLTPKAKLDKMINKRRNEHLLIMIYIFLEFSSLI
jgi:hypothetical protein